MYFAKRTYSCATKNRLQEAAQQFVKHLEYQLVESPDDLFTFIQERITLLNRSYSRCTALVASKRKAYDEDTFCFDVSGIITLTLYPVKGEFSKTAKASSSNTGPVNYATSGTQQTLFS